VHIKNEKGIALVTALMFTMISLGIIMMLLYMVTQATKISSANKMYKTALEASYGAVDLITKDIFSQLMKSAIPTGTSITAIAANYSAINMTFPDSANCLAEKLKKPTSLWSTSVCTATTRSIDSTVKPDFTINLKAINDSTGYIVSTKIVDTKCTAPLPECTNSYEPASTGNVIQDATIQGLIVGASASDPGSTKSVSAQPVYYTIEVQGQRASNPREKTKLSVLYAY
jgi:hypothetical protein